MSFGFAIMDIHTRVLMLSLSLIGAQIYLFSIMLFLSSEDLPSRISQRLIHLDESWLFVASLIVFGSFAAFILFLFYAWYGAGFSNLHFRNTLAVVMHFLLLPFSLTVGLLGVHILKRT
jgi:hypothetical protein